MYELVIIMVALVFTGLGIVAHGYILTKKQQQQEKIIKAIKKMVEEEIKNSKAEPKVEIKEKEVNENE